MQEAGSLAGSVQSVEVDTPYGPLHVTVQVDTHTHTRSTYIVCSCSQFTTVCPECGTEPSHDNLAANLDRPTAVTRVAVYPPLMVEI